MTTLVVETRRGNAVESVHRVSVAVTDAAGRLVARAGDPHFPTFLRSAAKPFQAIPIVESGTAAKYGFTPAELALICASHNSEPEQVDRVQAMLERIGCGENDLACGPHRPLWRDLSLPAETRGLEEVPRTRVASNCSGKHTGMLAFARHSGWPTAGYERSDHEVQRRCLQEVARWADVSVSSVPAAVDGCGVQCFALPLDRMARAFAALVTSADPSARAVTAAMMDHPELVAGRGRLDTALMRAYRGQVLAKVGAEGVYAAALPVRGLGVGIKVEDGHGWSAAIALLTVLAQLDLSPSPVEHLSAYAVYPLRNTRGDVTGEMRCTGTLTFD